MNSHNAALRAFFLFPSIQLCVFGTRRLLHAPLNSRRCYIWRLALTNRCWLWAARTPAEMEIKTCWRAQSKASVTVTVCSQQLTVCLVCYASCRFVVGKSFKAPLSSALMSFCLVWWGRVKKFWNLFRSWLFKFQETKTFSGSGRFQALYLTA